MQHLDLTSIGLIPVANLVGGAIALSAIVNLAGVLLLPGADLGDARWNAQTSTRSPAPDTC